MEIGSAYKLDERMTMEIKGRHLIEGVPKTITISDEEIREALAETVNVIVDAVRVALERTPPELSADIVDRGIVLTGGGSMLKNLDKRLREETGLPLAMAEDPLSSVVLGRGQDAVGFQPSAKDLDRLAAHSQFRDGPSGYSAAHRLVVRSAGRFAHHPHLRASHHETGVPVLQELTFGVFAEMQRAATSGLSSAREGWQNYFALQQIRQENERLKKEVTQLSVSLQQERAAAQQTQTLQSLLDLKSAIPFKTTAAKVIGSGADPEFRTITIDKGTQDGLRTDMAVIAPAGIVGRVLMPTARAAKVQLIIDRDAAAGGVIERSRAGGGVSGIGSTDALEFRIGLLKLEYVPGSADVKKGDRWSHLESTVSTLKA
jgi:hypothetical protein